MHFTLLHSHKPNIYYNGLATSRLGILFYVGDHKFIQIALLLIWRPVEHHFSSTKPYHLFLTETHLSVAIDSNPFSVPSYFLYLHFQSKASCYLYVRNNITCFCVHNLESSEFSTIWLRLQCHSLITFICVMLSSYYVKFFYYLTSKVKYILSHFLMLRSPFLGIYMFITNCGFHPRSLTNPVKMPSTLLSSTA